MLLFQIKMICVEHSGQILDNENGDLSVQNVFDVETWTKQFHDIMSL